jgi:hypothetical protein
VALVVRESATYPRISTELVEVLADADFSMLRDPRVQIAKSHPKEVGGFDQEATDW